MAQPGFIPASQIDPTRIGKLQQAPRPTTPKGFIPASQIGPASGDGEHSAFTTWTSQHLPALTGLGEALETPGIRSPVASALGKFFHRTSGTGMGVGSGDWPAAYAALVGRETPEQYSADTHTGARALSLLLFGVTSEQEYQRLPSWMRTLVEGATQTAEDPSSWLGGIGSDAARFGTRWAARTAARVMPETSQFGTIGNSLRSYAGAGIANRFGRVMEDAGQHAYSAARATGKSISEAERARHAASMNAYRHATIAAQSRKYGQGMGQRFGERVYGRLSRTGEQQLARRMEQSAFHDPAMVKKVAAATKGTSKLRPMDVKSENQIATGIREHIASNRRLDRLVTDAGFATPGELWNPETYTPRAGWTQDARAPAEGDPAFPDEPVLDMEDFLRSRRSGGGFGVRRGTLAMSRVRPTMNEMETAGYQMDPEFSPRAVGEAHVARRYASVRFEQAMQGMRKDPGLMRAKPVLSNGEVDTRAVPPPGFVDPMRYAGNDIRTLGSPTLRTHFVRPSVVDYLSDLTALDRPQGTLENVMEHANTIARLGYTSQPIFHIGTNLIGNVTRHVLLGDIDPAVFARELKSGAAVEEAQEAGADLPYVSSLRKEVRARQWRDLPFSEKVKAAANIPYEHMSHAPIFKYAQPRIAAAAYKGAQAAGHTDPEALNIVRSIVGRPENVSTYERGAADLFPFYGWRKEQLLSWPTAIARKPWLYSGPHNVAGQWNATMGRQPQQSDWNALIPPIALGDGQQLHISTPADFAVGTLNEAASGQGNKLATRALMDVNLIPSLGGRYIYTQAHYPVHQLQPWSPLLYDKSAPAYIKAREALARLFGQYSPSRNRPWQQPWSLWGTEVEPTNP